MNKRCFVLDQCKKNVDAAAEHGEIVFVFEPVNGRSSVWSEAFPGEVLIAFKGLKFDPQHDYFVAVGQQTPLFIALGVLLAEYGAINMLMYYPPEERYVNRVVGKVAEHAKLL